MPRILTEHPLCVCVREPGPRVQQWASQPPPGENTMPGDQGQCEVWGIGEAQGSQGSGGMPGKQVQRV